MENVVVSWITGRLFGEHRTLTTVARRSLRRKALSYRPRTYTRRKARSALRRIL